MGKLDGKVAFITGVARGQGRCHAVRFAEEGADIIGVDICAPIPSVPYPLASPEDLAETAATVRGLGRRFVGSVADVRDEAAVQQAFDEGNRELGKINIANAGIAPLSLNEAPAVWKDTLDVNLTGAFNSVESALPTPIEGGRGGSVVLTSSTTGLTGVGGGSRAGLSYGAAKHGLVGLMRSYANSLARHSIRVNTIHPTGVNTPMATNEAVQAYAAADPAMATNALPVPMVEPIDITNAVLWLASDDARYVTGVALPVDAGFTNKK